MAIEPSTKTAQNQVTVSINRQSFMDIMVLDQDLSLTDWRVYALLLTHLDAKQYKSVSPKNIAETLGIKKKEAKQSIRNLIYLGKIVEGDSDSVKNGLRFTF